MASVLLESDDEGAELSGGSETEGVVRVKVTNVDGFESVVDSIEDVIVIGVEGASDDGTGTPSEVEELELTVKIVVAVSESVRVMVVRFDVGNGAVDEPAVELGTGNPPEVPFAELVAPPSADDDTVVPIENEIEGPLPVAVG